ncbi:MAG: L-asparaginase [Alphaproteobacteria bacterium CG_4_9_14_3_um_filter_47_13]|nr:MAG: L-asparaginase [Alphaproteobacteria bacterium CG_4_9_14_3_um_filter_47_13]
MIKKSKESFSLAIHGGAGGTIKKARESETVVKQTLHDILERGRTILARGGSSIDAVTSCVGMLEDCPLFNAGYGAVSNSAGQYELDAAIMDGKTLKAGAVAAVLNVKNPVDLARLVMEKTPHILLSGKGAIAFAKMQNVPMVTQKYFKDAQEKASSLIDKNKKHGTVGAVARDLKGNLAAATSTGGWGAKMPGRIGDSPLIGAGNFANNDSGAISCTGIGEHFIRTVLAGYIGFLIERENMDASEAAMAALIRLTEKFKGEGGFIVVDKNGYIAAAQTTKIMRCGWIEHGGEIHVTLQETLRIPKT